MMTNENARPEPTYEAVKQRSHCQTPTGINLPYNILLEESHVIRAIRSPFLVYGVLILMKHMQTFSLKASSQR